MKLEKLKTPGSVKTEDVKPLIIESLKFEKAVQSGSPSK